ncbi:MAG: sulfotransferase [Planctomycetales bacterium]|nr:sulfotransferase [Planctomycetales bacterium]
MSHTTTRFVILGQARSGTWFYTHLLNQHPLVIAAGELFHFSATVRREMFASILPNGDVNAELHAMNGQLRPYVYDPIAEANPNARAIGFKLLYEHADGWWARGDRCLERDTSVRVLHIVRNDPLNVLISWRIACLDQSWWGTRTTRQIWIDPASALEWLRRREQWLAWAENLRGSHAMLSVSYDQMIANPQAAMDKACDFLSIDSIAVTKPAYERQDIRQHLRDKIENYDQLVSVLENTRWALPNREQCDE